MGKHPTVRAKDLIEILSCTTPPLWQRSPLDRAAHCRDGQTNDHAAHRPPHRTGRAKVERNRWRIKVFARRSRYAVQVSSLLDYREAEALVRYPSQ